MDEAFQKLWRSITVESVDEEKIAEYLNKQGITYADDPGVRKVNDLHTTICFPYCRLK